MQHFAAISSLVRDLYDDAHLMALFHAR